MTDESEGYYEIACFGCEATGFTNAAASQYEATYRFTRMGWEIDDAGEWWCPMCKEEEDD